MSRVKSLSDAFQRMAMPPIARAAVPSRRAIVRREPLQPRSPRHIALECLPPPERGRPRCRTAAPGIAAGGHRRAQQPGDGERKCRSASGRAAGTPGHSEPLLGTPPSAPRAGSLQGLAEAKSNKTMRSLKFSHFPKKLMNISDKF